MANKLNKLYNEIKIACHILPNEQKPQKHDLNPDHLKEGTTSDNSYDAASYHSGYKLTLNLANTIRREAHKTSFLDIGSKKEFDQQWALKLNVSESTISKVRSNKLWRR